jgi:predicted RNase H-like HicB family nuclease
MTDEAKGRSMTDHNEVPDAAVEAFAKGRDRYFRTVVAAFSLDEAVRAGIAAAVPYLTPQPPTEPTRAEDAPQTDEAKRIAEILRKPYHFTVIPDEGSFFAKVQEFPGCFATGDTAPEALASLLSVAESWLMATIARGQSVPDPAEDAPHVEPGGEREKLIEAACPAICADTSFGVSWEDLLWACSHTEDDIGRTIFEQKRDRVRRIAAGVIDAVSPLRSSRDAVLEEAAKVADQDAEESRSNEKRAPKDEVGYHRWAVDTAVMIAKRIRALKASQS